VSLPVASVFFNQIVEAGAEDTVRLFSLTMRAGFLLLDPLSASFLIVVYDAVRRTVTLFRE